MSFEWDVNFLRGRHSDRRALIVLNQPFSRELLESLWAATSWHACADGGANRLYDSGSTLTPDIIKGDLDSIRDDVREHYTSLGIPVVQDPDMDSTDLMKCVSALQDKERAERTAYDLILLGGLSGRLDQTVHTLSYLHKLRKTRERVFAATDDNIGWVLGEGKHLIRVDHTIVGPTCGLLPVGITSTQLTTSGLRWNLNNTTSSFDSLVSTSNHLIPGEDVLVETSNPIWWVMELRPISSRVEDG